MPNGPVNSRTTIVKPFFEDPHLPQDLFLRLLMDIQFQEAMLNLERLEMAIPNQVMTHLQPNLDIWARLAMEY